MIGDVVGFIGNEGDKDYQLDDTKSEEAARDDE